MSDFEFDWQHNEANFGLPETKEIDGGTHFTIEIVLRHEGKFVAVRRPHGYPGHQLPPKTPEHQDGFLYFCHDLPRWGESLPEAVTRIVDSQIGVSARDIAVVDFEMQTYPDEQHEGNRQWALTLYVVADLDALPEISGEVAEVLTFERDSAPSDMGWWEKDEVVEFIEQVERVR